MLREKGVCGRVFCFKFNGTIFRQNNDAAKGITNISSLPLTAVTKNKNSFSICFGFRGANKGLFALLALHKYGHLPQTSACNYWLLLQKPKSYARATSRLYHPRLHWFLSYHFLPVRYSHSHSYSYS